MRFAGWLLTIVALAAAIGGCSEKTPEQIEAEKYPTVKKLSPEEERAARQRLHLDGPLQQHKEGSPTGSP